MHSSDNGIHNASFTISTTELNVKTDNTNPSLVIKEDSDNDIKNVDNNNGDSSPGCASMCRQFLSDWPSLLLLLFLYMLQGLPLGLIVSIPLIIQEKSATYNQQATFKFASWPWSMKLLWAPLVDALYVKRIGRRKSWLIPVQYLLAITLLVLSFQVDHLIDTMQIGLLTAYFFLLNTLGATQDICVDGWALTMLRRENVALAATVAQAGQLFGNFIGHVVFLNLASEDFSNNYLRPVPKPGGIVTISSFMVFWSCVCFVTTTLIFIFKPEGNTTIQAKKDHTILKNYFILYKICKVSAVRWYVLFLLTKHITLSAVIGVSDIKLVEYGLSKETKSLLTVPLIPISIFLPVIIARWTCGPKPLSIFKKTYLFAVLTSGIVGVMVWVTGAVKDRDGGFPGWYFPVLVIVECAFKACQTILNVSHLAFHTTIADPDYGSTILTFYNTLTNLGGVAPQALALYLVDPLTITEVCNDATTVCDKPTTIIFDGYYTLTIACVLIGACWFIWGRRIINRFQKTPESEFQIKRKRINNA